LDYSVSLIFLELLIIKVPSIYVIVHTNLSFQGLAGPHIAQSIVRTQGEHLFPFLIVLVFLPPETSFARQMLTLQGLYQ
jgi:ABC-type Fe3+-siderophore transport system permease subunit